MRPLVASLLAHVVVLGGLAGVAVLERGRERAPPEVALAWASAPDLVLEPPLPPRARVEPPELREIERVRQEVQPVRLPRAARLEALPFEAWAASAPLPRPRPEFGRGRVLSARTDEAPGRGVDPELRSSPPVVMPADPSGATASPVEPSPTPALVAWSAPAYPERARRRGIEGDVVVEADVRRDGTVGAARVMRSSGSPLLDRAAVEAVLEWTFEHAGERGGERGDGDAAVTLELPAIRFRLVNRRPRP